MRIHKLKLLFFSIVIFILYISYKILQPEIKENRGRRELVGDEDYINVDTRNNNKRDDILKVDSNKNDRVIPPTRPEFGHVVESQEKIDETHLRNSQEKEEINPRFGHNIDPGLHQVHHDIKSDHDTNQDINPRFGHAVLENDDDYPLGAKDHNDNNPNNIKGEMVADQQKLLRKLLGTYDIDVGVELDQGISPWRFAARLVTSRQIHPDNFPELGAILHEMSTRRILAADVGYKGTQLKLSLLLEGGQKVAFKPKWFSRDHVIVGQPYDGADRHNGEIAAFHLNRLLGFNRSPLAVGRVVNLEKEIKPVASERLLNTFFYKDKNTCFYGKCLYCRGEQDGVCGEGASLEGTIVLWLDSKWKFGKHIRHPWQRTYKDGIQARWEYDNNYCNNVVKVTSPNNKPPRLLDLLDANVFDYIIGNADRHHYETFLNHSDSMVVMLDSAKSFGNPYLDEPSILAPLRQCCMLRKSTWRRLKLLQNGILSEVMREILSKDPIAPVLTEPHLMAMDRRLATIVNAVNLCIAKNGEKVLQEDSFSKLPEPFYR
ncbi:unnamed protein product [Owenia fusiformis]|uniref:Uncharacterized protein n=1 Tax=Owenia fusiformis TaxID=6347 RepID=A0A8J1UQJ5_OWEFU|nr:unnamed protein product [Owenia fusiformis]